MQSMEYYLPLPFFSHAHQTKESSLPILISIPSLLLPLQHFIPITSLPSTKRAVNVMRYLDGVKVKPSINLNIEI